MGCCQATTTTSAQDCQCGCAEPLERVRYFPRQLLTADDMRAEQEYFRAKMRRHNRMLFGRGVACGLQVQPKDPNAPDSSVLTICPGYALSPMGDDIHLGEPFDFDLDRCLKPRVPECPPAAVKAANAEGYETGAEERREFFIAIRPLDCATRPVRTLPEGCACDDSACEYSRVREGFEVQCLETLPDSHAVLVPSLAGKGKLGATDKIGMFKMMESSGGVFSMADAYMNYRAASQGTKAAEAPAAAAAAPADAPQSAEAEAKIESHAGTPDWLVPSSQKASVGLGDMKFVYKPSMESSPPLLAWLLEGLLGACPPCPQDNWVVLAGVVWWPGKGLRIQNEVRRRVVNLSTILERATDLLA